MPIQPRPEIERVPPVTHGGFHSEHATDWLDFSSNVNPFGPSPRIWDAMRAVPIGQHPDPRAAPLRQVLAEVEGVDAHQVLVGNGLVELIYHLAVAYLRAGDCVLVVEPTFREYAAAGIMGAEVIRYRTRREEEVALEVDAWLHLAHQVNPGLLFLCNPNNATGAFLERDVIEQWLRGCPDTLLVLDEAFIRFVADACSSRELHTFGNLLVLRSLTKDVALTGLRVGYTAALPTIIDGLEKVQPPWSVNALAQAAAIAALRDEGDWRASLDSLARAKSDLVDNLTRLGLAPLHSRVHFFLLPVPSAAEFGRKLLERNIVVRDGTSFGLPTFVRIAARRLEENAQLASALEK